MGKNLADYAKNLELAQNINAIKEIAIPMDQDYMKVAAKGMIDQGNWQDSAAVLNPTHLFEKNDLLRLQGDTLMKLWEFIDGLKKCEELKAKIYKSERAQSDIMKMFM